MIKNKLLRSVGLGALLAFLAACDTTTQQKFAAVPSEEASTATFNSDEAFVRRVIPVLLGRQPLGSNEVYGLVEIIKASSRSKAVDLIMARSEFADYWTSVLIEDLKPELVGSWDPPKLMDTGCLTETWLANVDTARVEAANWVANHGPEEPFFYSVEKRTVDFTMRDLVRGAILGDKLQSIYAAWISMLTSTNGLNGGEVAQVMLGTLMNRNHDCMHCHASGHSATLRDVDSQADPNRHFPRTWGGSVVDLEASVFPDGYGDSYYNGHLGAFFAADAANHAAGSFSWGLFCAEAPLPVTNGSGAGAHFAGHDGPPLPPKGSTSPPVGPGVGTAEVIAAFRSGVSKLNTGMNLYDSMTTTADPEAAFAYMVANNVVDNVFEEVTGARLTLNHGFSRTADQQFLHAALVNAFLGDKLATTTVVERPQTPTWSLKALLKAMVVDNTLFNRKDPARSPGTTLYPLPMIYDPWALTLPATTAGFRANGQGDAVNRRSAVALFNTRAKAHGDTFSFSSVAGITAYPTFDDAGELGAHVSGSNVANRSVGLNALMAWAARPAESATNLGPWAARLDALVKATWNAQGVSSKYRYLDLVIAVKDRVLNQPTLGTTNDPALGASETALVLQYLTTAQNPIDLLTSYVKQGWYENGGLDRLLKYMALLEETPQYLLSGLPPQEVLPPTYPDPTRLDVCLPGEPCSIKGWITNYGFTQPVLSCTLAGGTGSGSGAGSGSCSASVSLNNHSCFCDSGCLSRKDCCFDRFEVCL